MSLPASSAGNRDDHKGGFIADDRDETAPTAQYARHPAAGSSACCCQVMTPAPVLRHAGGTRRWPDYASPDAAVCRYEVRKPAGKAP